MRSNNRKPFYDETTPQLLPLSEKEFILLEVNSHKLMSDEKRRILQGHEKVLIYVKIV